MSQPIYSLEAWRRLKERKPNPPQSEQEAPGELTADQAPPGSIFDGKRYTPEEWFASHVIRVPTKPAPDEKCPVHWADCGDTRVWIVKDGSRWLMYAGSRQPDSRRTDFASPFLNHAMQTAEHWYGLPRDGWHAEKLTAKSSQ